MKDFLVHIPLIDDLTHLIEWLLLMNVILIGAVILLAFKATQYKHRSEELEAELNEAIGNTISEATPDTPVPHRRATRR